MSKIAIIFPGQGSQYVGMGQEIAKTPIGEKLFSQADAALGFSLSNLCFEGPAEELTLTYNTQPAIVIVSLIAYQLLIAQRIKPEMTAGHSQRE